MTILHDSIDTELNNIIDNLDEDVLETLDEDTINKIKSKILSKLPLSKDQLDDFMYYLRSYKYVDEIDELKLGCYYKWINMKSLIEFNTLKITNGGFLYAYDVSSDGSDIILKFHKRRRIKNAPHPAECVYKNRHEKSHIFQNSHTRRMLL